ncbi:MAG: peptide-methionine (S)-S-oxide reductase MsrA [Candidatus Pacebacteria bacterium]|nr:peptide-methionine (S)-S-oxide reductase MsrA [Candidatus Paceibacterota bacterium]
MKTNIKTEKAIFASGCFWGTQHHFDKHEGVISTLVGYTGGTSENPTYEEVSTDSTGHREAIEIVFDPTRTSYESLTKLFFETHNFSQPNGQGPDIGERYTSAVYYMNEKQKEIAEKLVTELESKNLTVTTKILATLPFYPAEEHHQKYYEKTGGAPYCHVYIKRFND